MSNPNVFRQQKQMKWLCHSNSLGQDCNRTFAWTHNTIVLLVVFTERMHLMTGRTSSTSNNVHQISSVATDQTCTPVSKNFRLISTNLLQVNQYIWDFLHKQSSSGDAIARLRSGCLIGQYQNMHFLIFNPFCCWFWVSVLYYSTFIEIKIMENKPLLWYSPVKCLDTI